MIFRFVVTFGLLFMLWMTPAAAQQRDEITVVDARFTSAVQNREPVDALATQLTHPPVVFWTRMQASKDALVRLRRDGRLPIRHRWTRFVGMTGDTSTGVITDDISGAIGSADFLSALERELAARTFFDWRYWSEKKNMSKGQWQVEIVYANGSPVTCKRGNQSDEPCIFLIEVR